MPTPRKRTAKKATAKKATAAKVKADGAVEGALVTDDGGRPVTDDGGRPVVIDAARRIATAIRHLVMAICRLVRLVASRPVQLALANTPGLLTAASPAAPEVNLQARTITGLIVPYGQVGETSQGRVTYARGSLRLPTDTRRVKLLVEHDQGQAVGYATGFDDREDGLYATFHVPPGAAGDQVLLSASYGVRDGLSVGVQLDDVTRQHLRRAQASGGGAVAATGQLREVSSVSVPAFDDSRVAAVASAELVVSAWSDPTNTGGNAMPCTICHQHHAVGVACPSSPPPATASTPAPPAPSPTPDPAPAPTPPAPTPDPAPGPDAPPLATAGAAALVTAEASVYSLDGTGPSLVRDAYYAGMHRDPESAERLARFNAQLNTGNAPSVLAVAAVTTTADLDGDQAFGLAQPTYRPDLLRAAVDRARPIISRLSTITITSAAPFTIPMEGEFDGVADHVEGTAHVPEGTLTGGDATLTPKAVSGAYRVSRELVDASNPAIDRIAVRAMVRDYRRLTEAKVVAALAAVGAADLGVDTLMELRAKLIDFMGDDDTMADFVAAGRTFMATLAAETDGNDRPMLATYGAGTLPSVGQARPGWTGVSIDGTELVRASAVAPAEAYIVEADAVLWAESRTQTFRFDEVEGPGVIKLALWGYCGAAVIDAAGVDRLTTAAA